MPGPTDSSYVEELPQESHNPVEEYAIAIGKGAIGALTDFGKMVIHPIDNYLVPLFHFYKDLAIIIRDTPKVPGSFGLVPQSKASIEAQDRLLKPFIDFALALQQGSGPERAEMLTQFLGYSFLRGKASQIGIQLIKNKYNLGTFFPPEYRNTIPEKVVPTTGTKLFELENMLFDPEMLNFKLKMGRKLIYTYTRNGLTIVDRAAPLFRLRTDLQTGKECISPYVYHNDIGGKRIFLGGEIIMPNGKILVNNFSGHFLPANSIGRSIAHVLKRHGIPFDGLTLLDGIKVTGGSNVSYLSSLLRPIVPPGMFHVFPLAQSMQDILREHGFEATPSVTTPRTESRRIAEDPPISESSKLSPELPQDLLPEVLTTRPRALSYLDIPPPIPRQGSSAIGCLLDTMPFTYNSSSNELIIGGSVALSVTTGMVGNALVFKGTMALTATTGIVGIAAAAALAGAFALINWETIKKYEKRKANSEHTDKDHNITVLPRLKARTQQFEALLQSDNVEDIQNFIDSSFGEIKVVLGKQENLARRIESAENTSTSWWGGIKEKYKKALLENYEKIGKNYDTAISTHNTQKNILGIKLAYIQNDEAKALGYAKNLPESSRAIETQKINDYFRFREKYSVTSLLDAAVQDDYNDFQHKSGSGTAIPEELELIIEKLTAAAESYTKLRGEASAMPGIDPTFIENLKAKEEDLLSKKAALEVQGLQAIQDAMAKESDELLVCSDGIPRKIKSSQATPLPDDKIIDTSKLFPELDNYYRARDLLFLSDMAIRTLSALFQLAEDSTMFSPEAKRFIGISHKTFQLISDVYFKKMSLASKLNISYLMSSILLNLLPEEIRTKPIIRTFESSVLVLGKTASSCQSLANIYRAVTIASSYQAILSLFDFGNLICAGIERIAGEKIPRPFLQNAILSWNSASSHTGMWHLNAALAFKFALDSIYQTYPDVAEIIMRTSFRLVGPAAALKIVQSTGTRLLYSALFTPLPLLQVPLSLAVYNLFLLWKSAEILSDLPDINQKVRELDACLKANDPQGALNAIAKLLDKPYISTKFKQDLRAQEEFVLLDRKLKLEDYDDAYGQLLKIKRTRKLTTEQQTQLETTRRSLLLKRLKKYSPRPAEVFELTHDDLKRRPSAPLTNNDEITVRQFGEAFQQRPDKKKQHAFNLMIKKLGRENPDNDVVAEVYMNELGRQQRYSDIMRFIAKRELVGGIALKDEHKHLYLQIQSQYIQGKMYLIDVTLRIAMMLLPQNRELAYHCLNLTQDLLVARQRYLLDAISPMIGDDPANKELRILFSPVLKQRSYIATDLITVAQLAHSIVGITNAMVDFIGSKMQETIMKTPKGKDQDLAIKALNKKIRALKLGLQGIDTGLYSMEFGKTLQRIFKSSTLPTPLDYLSLLFFASRAVYGLINAYEEYTGHAVRSGPAITLKAIGGAALRSKALYSYQVGFVLTRNIIHTLPLTVFYLQKVLPSRVGIKLGATLLGEGSIHASATAFMASAPVNVVAQMWLAYSLGSMAYDSYNLGWFYSFDNILKDTSKLIEQGQYTQARETLFAAGKPEGYLVISDREHLNLYFQYCDLYKQLSFKHKTASGPLLQILDTRLQRYPYDTDLLHLMALAKLQLRDDIVGGQRYLDRARSIDPYNKTTCLTQTQFNYLYARSDMFFFELNVQLFSKLCQYFHFNTGYHLSAIMRECGMYYFNLKFKILDLTHLFNEGKITDLKFTEEKAQLTSFKGQLLNLDRGSLLRFTSVGLNFLESRIVSANKMLLMNCVQLLVALQYLADSLFQEMPKGIYLDVLFSVSTYYIFIYSFQLVSRMLAIYHYKFAVNPQSPLIALHGGIAKHIQQSTIMSYFYYYQIYKSFPECFSLLQQSPMLQPIINFFKDHLPAINLDKLYYETRYDDSIKQLVILGYLLYSGWSVMQHAGALTTPTAAPTNTPSFFKRAALKCWQYVTGQKKRATASQFDDPYFLCTDVKNDPYFSAPVHTPPTVPEQTSTVQPLGRTLLKYRELTMTDQVQSQVQSIVPLPFAMRHRS